MSQQDFPRPAGVEPTTAARCPECSSTNVFMKTRAVVNQRLARDQFSGKMVLSAVRTELIDWAYANERDGLWFHCARCGHEDSEPQPFFDEPIRFES